MAAAVAAATAAKSGTRRTQGVGLASMRERLHQIGGRLEIDSVAGRTTLTALIPIGDTQM